MYFAETQLVGQVNNWVKYLIFTLDPLPVFHIKDHRFQELLLLSVILYQSDSYPQM